MISKIPAVLAVLMLTTSCHINVNLSEDDYAQRLVVNGVSWASSNVAVPGLLAPNQQDYGGHFDFETAQRVCPAGWRTPTQREWAELLSVEHYWTTERGIRGLMFRLDDRFLFLPAGGSGSDNTLDHAGKHGFYWSSTPNKTTSLGEEVAYCLHFDERSSGTSGDYLQEAGFSVRCVK